MSKELFTERLNYMMEKRKMKISDLARKSGIDKGTINAYQKGRFNAIEKPLKQRLFLYRDSLKFTDFQILGIKWVSRNIKRHAIGMSSLIRLLFEDSYSLFMVIKPCIRFIVPLHDLIQPAAELIEFKINFDELLFHSRSAFNLSFNLFFLPFM